MKVLQPICISSNFFFSSTVFSTERPWPRLFSPWYCPSFWSIWRVHHQVSCIFLNVQMTTRNISLTLKNKQIPFVFQNSSNLNAKKPWLRSVTRIQCWNVSWSPQRKSSASKSDLWNGRGFLATTALVKSSWGSSPRKSTWPMVIHSQTPTGATQTRMCRCASPRLLYSMRDIMSVKWKPAQEMLSLTNSSPFMWQVSCCPNTVFTEYTREK